MLIQLFKKAYVTQYLALFILQFVLWTPAFIIPDIAGIPEAQSSNPGYEFIRFLFGEQMRLLSLLAFFLVYVSALLLNNNLVNHQMIPKNSLLAALVYIILMSYSAYTLTLYPVLISNFFIMLVLSLTFRLYAEKEAYSKVFNIGILFAIISLFYFDAVMLFVFLWLAFYVYRIYSWRDWLIPFVGFITIYFFLGIYYFWVDGLQSAILNHQLKLDGFFNFQFGFSADYFSLSILGIFGIFFLAAFAKLLGHINDYIISVRKHYWTIVLLFLLTLILILITGTVNELSILLMAVPAAIILTEYIVRLKRTFWADLFIWFVVILILINNYYALISYQFLN
jgi:hypothetical protein